MDILIIELGTLHMAVHENIQRLTFDKSNGVYIVIEADGSQTGVKKDEYMLTILR